MGQRQGEPKGSEQEAEARQSFETLGKPCTTFSASCTSSTLNGPGGLLGWLALIPKFVGAEMKTLALGEGSRRPSVARRGGARQRDKGPSL